MALEIKFKVINLNQVVSRAGFTVMDKDRNDFNGFTKIEEDGSCVIPVPYGFSEEFEQLRVTVDDFTGDNFDESGSSTDWAEVSEVFENWGIKQEGYFVHLQNESLQITPWDMGDGVMFTPRNSTYLYKKNGTYTIKNGTFSATVVITGITEFSVVLVDNVVTCKAQSGITSSWDFGDNAVSGYLEVAYTYYENGTYIVSHGEYSKTIVIDWYSENAVQSVADNKVVFNVIDGISEGDIYSYGDGRYGTSREHEYAQHGRYLVEVNDQRFFVDIEASVMPTGGYTFKIGESNIEKKEYIFTGIGGNEYEWIIDGTVYSDSPVSHLFTEPNTYNLLLKAISSNGSVGYTQDQLGVSLPLPPNENPQIVDFIVEPSGREVTFGVTATDYSTDVLSYFWYLGDGVSSYSQNHVHTYDADGVYDIVCVVSDNRGGESTVNQTITIDSSEYLGPELIPDSKFSTDTMVADGWSDGFATLVWSGDIYGDGSNQTGLIAQGRTENSASKAALQLNLEIGADYEMTVTANQSTFQSQNIFLNDGAGGYYGYVINDASGVWQTYTINFTATTSDPTVNIQVKKQSYGASKIALLSIRKIL